MSLMETEYNNAKGEHEKAQTELQNTLQDGGGMKMENKEKELEEWIEVCPLPVIGRVVDNEADIRHVAMSYFIYEEDALIAVPLSTLASLLKY